MDASPICGSRSIGMLFDLCAVHPNLLCPGQCESRVDRTSDATKSAGRKLALRGLRQKAHLSWRSMATNAIDCLYDRVSQLLESILRPDFLRSMTRSEIPLLSGEMGLKVLPSEPAHDRHNFFCKTYSRRWEMRWLDGSLGMIAVNAMDSGRALAMLSCEIL
jgi:hypothetical protein